MQKIKPRIVIDTNVIIAAFRSTRGASFLLLEILAQNLFSLHLSVPLLFEYEEVLAKETPLPPLEITAFIARLNAIGVRQKIFFLFRWFLQDHNDDMVLELAIAAQATHIITFNKRDLQAAQSFNILVLTPKEFLQSIGVIS